MSQPRVSAAGSLAALALPSKYVANSLQWSGAFDPNNPDQDGSVAFFYLLEKLPAWTVGIVLVMVVSLSTAAFDSFQSAMVSTASNDLFRNKLNIWWVRGAGKLDLIVNCSLLV